MTTWSSSSAMWAGSTWQGVSTSPARPTGVPGPPPTAAWEQWPAGHVMAPRALGHPPQSFLTVATPPCHSSLGGLGYTVGAGCDGWSQGWLCP